MEIKEQLHLHWIRLMLMLGLQKNSGVLFFDMIIEKYLNEKRKFHDAQLLLSILDEYKKFQGQDPAIYFAIWFIHYSVAKTEKIKISETEDIILYISKTLPVDKITSEKVLRLIRSLTNNSPKDYEEKIFRDLHLLSLSKDRNEFISDRIIIRNHYSNMSDYLFNQFQSNFFRNILKKGSVYYTAPFIEKYEKSAKENIFSVI